MTPNFPNAPWHLRGDTFAFLCRDASGKFGVRAFVRYADSPVGAYNEMAFAVLTRRGVRVTEMPVTLETSMRGGRAIWGFPKSLEQIEYSISRHRVVVGFRGRQIVARLSRFSLPIKLNAWTVQTLNGAEVRVPISVSGRAHLAFVGKRLAVYLDEFSLTVFAPEKLR